MAPDLFVLSRAVCCCFPLVDVAQVPPNITSFPNMGYQSLCAPPSLQHHALHSRTRSYATGPISVRSTCAHHFQNIVGKCWVGVIPETEVSTGTLHYHSHPFKCTGYHLFTTGTQVIGLSKFNRIVHHICERPQIQEEMTSQIADALRETVKPPHMSASCLCSSRCKPSHFFPSLPLTVLSEPLL